MLSPIDEWNINRGLDSGKKSICYKKLENGYVVIIMSKGEYCLTLHDKYLAQEFKQRISTSSAINEIKVEDNVITINQNSTDFTLINCKGCERLAIKLVKNLRKQNILDEKLVKASKKEINVDNKDDKDIEISK